MCCVGHGPWGYQSVLPCMWAGSKENIPRQEPGVTVLEVCLVPVHSDDRYVDQDICEHSDITGYTKSDGFSWRDFCTGGPVHSSRHGWTQSHC